jgi:hypothetical protein
MSHQLPSEHACERRARPLAGYRRQDHYYSGRYMAAASGTGSDIARHGETAQTRSYRASRYEEHGGRKP